MKLKGNKRKSLTRNESDDIKQHNAPNFLRSKQDPPPQVSLPKQILKT